MKNQNTGKKAKYLKLAAIAFCVVIMGASCIFLALTVHEHGLDAVIMRIKEIVDSLGVWGLSFMLLLQVIQVVLAFIPGEPLELCAGVLYGTVWGTLFCLTGILIGTLIIFIIVRRLGKPLVDRVIGSEKYKRLTFLKDPKKRDMLVFLLMFIPGTPKDVLTYFSPLTGMPMLRFLIISTVARIPSVISSTYVGDNVAEGDLLHSAIVFAVVGIISLGGILIYNKILDNKNKKADDSDNA